MLASAVLRRGMPPRRIEAPSRPDRPRRMAQARRPSAQPVARARHTTMAARGRPRVANVTWELRSFGASAAAIVAGFVLALLYLGQMTGVSATGYELQRLEAKRDELRRQSALLDVQLASLDAPARIEAQARRLGLLKPQGVTVLDAEVLAARR